jgi:FAD/FMN-containing dehydrogenase
MALFTQVIYDPKTTLVDVGPGLIWEDVYKVLTPFGRNVPGATTCKNVGVAGFNLGGGYSNKTNQFGLAIDVIKAIDVVLPTGDILTADADNNKEIFWSLKVCFSLSEISLCHLISAQGGGNNFGIVTKWTMITHPQGPISVSNLPTYLPLNGLTLFSLSPKHCFMILNTSSNSFP